jgi:hypothetical protein
MEGNRKNLGTPRSSGEIVIAEDLDEEDLDGALPLDEQTNPGVDLEVQSALTSLAAVQDTAKRKAFAMEVVLLRRNSQNLPAVSAPTALQSAEEKPPPSQ